VNAASLELSKELYELSGWGKSAYVYHIHDGLLKYFSYSDHSNQPYIVDGTAYSLSPEEKAGEHTPAYDLGYMLRKLPSTTNIGRVSINRYVIGLGSMNMKYKQFANTPEDVAAKLCIALFKKGVIRREDV
jgi:hypothetical protein